MNTANLTAAEVRELLISLLPPGATDLYDLGSPTSNVSLLFDALADSHKIGTDLVDTTRTETFPATATSAGLLAQWEKALGLTGSNTALTGTDAARQQQVVSTFRQYGAATLSDIRAVLEPLLGYQGADIGTLEIIETDRAALTEQHIYGDETVTISASSTSGAIIPVPDDGKVADMGAQVLLTVTHGSVEDLVVTLTGPDSTSYQWGLGSGAVTAKAYVLRSPSFAGATIFGTWTLSISNGGTNTGTATHCGIFVEGIGRDSAGFDGQGAAQFYWVFVVDGAKTHSPDLAAALAAAQRISPAHAAPPSYVTAAPVPSTDSAIPMRCIPHSNI